MSLESNIANLIGDTTRAKILTTMMDGRAFTAGELAMIANVSPQTASNHLSKLRQAKLILCETGGRHRYYKLASHRVAKVLESLSILTDSPKLSLPNHNKLPREISLARTCYDHLAGRLGVAITAALQSKQYIKLIEKNFIITTKGKQFFAELDIDVTVLTNLRRSFARPCLDWTERKYHLAGSLGKAILDYFLNHRLVMRSTSKPRVIVITTKGKKWLKSYLSIAALD
ncbi:MAG: winged helix-turn-helix domain-containing protein [Pseudomonadota bacterium]